MTLPLEQETVGGALTRLSSDLQHLPRALKRIAEHIQRDPQKMLYQTVTELATEAGVGDASIIRLCQTLGFKGFQDFKLALAVDLAQRPLERESLPETPGEIMMATLIKARKALQDTYQGIDAQALDMAAQRLVSARHVELNGQGASGITAQDFAYKLLRLGRQVSVQTDPHLAAMRVSTLGPQDVAFVISRSGSTIDAIQFLKLARQTGAYTIALTISHLSPIATFADCVLLTANPEGPSDGGSISNKISQMLVLEALYQLLRHRITDSDVVLRTTAEAVVEKSF